MNEFEQKIERNRLKIQKMISNGFSFYEIALEMKISESTLIKYLKKMDFLIKDNRIKRKKNAKYA